MLFYNTLEVFFYVYFIFLPYDFQSLKTAVFAKNFLSSQVQYLFFTSHWHLIAQFYVFEMAYACVSASVCMYSAKMCKSVCNGD